MTNNTIMMPFNGNSLPACTEWGSCFLLLVSSSNNFLFYLVGQEIRQDFLVKKSMDREEKHVSKVEKDPLVRQAMAMDPNAKQFYGVSEWESDRLEWIEIYLIYFLITSFLITVYNTSYNMLHMLHTYTPYIIDAVQSDNTNLWIYTTYINTEKRGTCCAENIILLLFWIGPDWPGLGVN